MENMTKEQQFNLPPAAVFNLQQIALADDDMVKAPGAAEKYRFIARHILELFTSIGSVAAPKEEIDEEPITDLHPDYVKEEVSKLMVYKIQAYEQLAELASLRQQLKEREEALKELLPIADNYRITVDNPDWEDENFKIKAIIEKARKLLSK